SVPRSNRRDRRLPLLPLVSAIPTEPVTPSTRLSLLNASSRPSTKPQRSQERIAMNRITANALTTLALALAAAPALGQAYDVVDLGPVVPNAINNHGH